MLVGGKASVAVSGAVATLGAVTAFCCISPGAAAASETDAAAINVLEEVAEVPAAQCSAPTAVPQQDRSSDTAQARAESTSNASTTPIGDTAAVAGSTASTREPELASYGPGFAWDDREVKPLEDAASQMFSLCLKWRATGETLNAFKLNKLEFILSRQVCVADLSDGALSRQQFTTALLADLLDRWLSADGRGPPQAAAARRAKVDSLVANLKLVYRVKDTADVYTPQEVWRHNYAGAYAQWLEREMRIAESRQLAVSPLKHVLLHYDRSLLLPGGLWLEFGVAEGATLGLIARHIPDHLADGVVIGNGESSGKCFGFDSFTGLPEAWRPGFNAGHFKRDRGEPPSFSPDVATYVSVVKGWFEDTLPPFLSSHSFGVSLYDQLGQPVALLHLDSDIYSAAIFVLRTLIADGRIVDGSVVVFDELFNYSGFENHESLALFEMVEQCGLEYDWIGMQQKGRMQAALRVTAVRGFTGATNAHARTVMTRPANGMAPLSCEPQPQQVETVCFSNATSVELTLNAALKRLEEIKLSLTSLEEEEQLARRSDADTVQAVQNGLRGSLEVQCESLMRAAAGLCHRQQQHLAHNIASNSTLLRTGGAEPVGRCMEGDALMAKGDFAAAAVQYGQAAARVGSGQVSAALKQLQREALLRAKSKKKISKRQRQSWSKAKQQQAAVVSMPRPTRCLPDSLATGNCRFDVRVTAAMAQALAQELLDIPGLTEEAGNDEKGIWSEADVRTSLESYKITEEMKRMQLRGRKEFFRKLSNDCPRFCALYEQFIREEIGPLLLAEFAVEQQAQHEEGMTTTQTAELDLETRTVLYQFPPAVRIYCSHITKPRKYAIPKHACALTDNDRDGSSGGEHGEEVPPVETDGNYVALTKLHADSLYGHQDGEVNFWMPFTSIDETSTLWAETEPGKGDWYPFYPLGPGGCWRFPGTNCRHFTKPNISGKTRVSLDFRCSVASCYDENWKKPGNSERHGMRRVVLPDTAGAAASQKAQAVGAEQKVAA